MDSCFPPLAALSLRDARGKIPQHPKNRLSHAQTPTQTPTPTPTPTAGKIEILQDLDLYYIRQIAHNLKEFDLEQKIELEIKMREGTTKLLAACKHQTQTLEAAKNLLTSNERMTAYMAELQRRKKQPSAPLGGGGGGCSARVSLSDVRMPLIWRDTDHFKNKGDYRRFAVFCLARVGTEIFDSTLLCPVDRALTDITFPDTLLFNNVPADFEFRLEVYSHVLRDDLSIASTPRKIKKTIHSSISRTVGKKLAASLRDELNTGKIGPHFELMASARLSLDDVNDGVRTHDLALAALDARTQALPLFGHFCCRLAAQPDCLVQECCSGEVSIQEAGPGGAVSGWGQLQAFRLAVWARRDQWQRGEDPLRSVVVDRDTVIRGGSATSKEVHLSNLSENKEAVTVLRVKSADEQRKWVQSLLQHAKDHRRWQAAAEKVMDVQPSTGGRLAFSRQPRQGSLYDEVPLIDSVGVAPRRPTAQDVFGLTPSSTSPTFRQRSASASKRSHWPFSKSSQE